MANIISITAAYFGHLITGYDFFILLTMISYSLDIYEYLTKH